MQDGLQNFAQASGQKLNYSKSNVFSTPNVPEQEAVMLSLKLGIPRTTNLGKYLGFKLRHYGSNMNTHSDLLNKAKDKLVGWRNKCLSRAGRITIARSVLNALPVFQMQPEKLPAHFHKKLDRLCRSCICGDEDHRGKTHWSTGKAYANPKRREAWVREVLQTWIRLSLPSLAGDLHRNKIVCGWVLWKANTTMMSFFLTTIGRENEDRTYGSLFNGVDICYTSAFIGEWWSERRCNFWWMFGLKNSLWRILRWHLLEITNLMYMSVNIGGEMRVGYGKNLLFYYLQVTC